MPKLLEKGFIVKALVSCISKIDYFKKHSNLQIIQDDSRKLPDEYFKDVDAIIDLVALPNDPNEDEEIKKEIYQINQFSRIRTAKLAKKNGVKRYILPSTCSVYGFVESNLIVNETSMPKPLTTYAKSNWKAEQGVLELANCDFEVIVLRQATVFGLSPKMRFNLAINMMTLNAWQYGVIPLMNNGILWRPMVHIQDTTDVMCLVLETSRKSINGEIINVGSAYNNYQLSVLAQEIAEVIPIDVNIQSFRDTDYRSYRVSFEKVGRLLNWKAKWTVADGVIEIYQALESGQLKVKALS